MKLLQMFTNQLKTTINSTAKKHERNKNVATAIKSWPTTSTRKLIAVLTLWASQYLLYREKGQMCFPKQEVKVI